MVVRLRRGALWSAVLLSLFAGSVGPATATSDVSPEYRVKAAYLAKLPLFVRWSAEALERSPGSLTIAVLGEDPFGDALDELEGRRIGERKAHVVRVRSPEQLDPGSVVFISASEQPRLRSILESLREKPILTVGDSEDFSAAGGIIGFVIVEDSVRFRVNLEAARAAGLEISSRLLRLAVDGAHDD